MLAQQKPLETAIRQEGSVAIIHLSGEIDGLAEEELRGAYQRAEDLEPSSILLNFTDVGYINSTGIALIVSLLASARKSHINLLTCGLSDHYKEIFQITRLADFMSMYEDEKEALSSA
jgi:anti-sigma B factor antagonist